MTPQPIPQLVERLRAAGFTRLQADYLPHDCEGQEEGWRIHDMPVEPAHVAYWICGGLEEGHAKLFVEAVNALPILLAQIEQLRAAVEPFAAYERENGSLALIMSDEEQAVLDIVRRVAEKPGFRAVLPGDTK